MENTAQSIMRLAIELKMGDDELSVMAVHLAMTTVNTEDEQRTRYVFPDLSAIAWDEERCEHYLCHPECWCEAKEHRCPR